MDATFIIPTSLDSNDRKENLDYVIKYIESFFNTNIIVGEEGEKRNFEYVSNNAGYVFLLNKNGLFHKTKILNNLIKLANTKIIISYDADVLANPLHIFYSVLLLRKNKADVVYPYNGDVVDADKKQKEKIFSKMNIFLHNKKYHYDRSRCFGGVCIANKDTFIDIGMENENFISWGVEDEERNIRFEKFSYRINRTPSVLIHLYHTRTINSTNNHSNYKSNSTEYEKINLMNREELKQYVKSWPWLKNVK
ncbi:MAG: galactosyltransferase-related protein [bacterium]